MSTFSAVLSALGLAPKTLPQANETLTQAKGTLDSVAALFTAAGLNLEQMLAAGPDSLKAHIDSLDNAEELAAALQENERLDGALKTAGEQMEAAGKLQAAHLECFKALGLTPDNNALAADQVKKSFDAHVSKQTTLALAKTGHPPAHVPAADPTQVAAKSDADLAKEYEALPRGEAKSAFYAKHEQALWRHEKSTRNRAE